MENELRGLNTATANILRKGGLDTRKKVAEAGEVQLLKLPMFGRRRMCEVLEWLGRDSPVVRRDIARSIKILEENGYTVTKPTD